MQLDRQESARLSGAYDATRTVAVWPSLRTAGRIALIFAAGCAFGASWMRGSPLRELELPSLSLARPAAVVAVEPRSALPAAPSAVAETVPAVEPAPAPPAPPAPAAAAAPAPVSAPARAPWQPPAATGTPYPARVERWRPLVRLILAEMWEQGRLDGYAARLDDDLVLALIEQESAGSPNATSWVGAIGLMQVMPFTFAEMMAGDKALADQIDPADMYDLTSNVRAGLRYLALAMNATEGNLYWSLAAYNGGIEAVDAWRAVGLYAVPPIGGFDQTAEYAQIILRNYMAHRPDVKIHVPDPMPYEHVPGAVELLLQAGRY